LAVTLAPAPALTADLSSTVLETLMKLRTLSAGLVAAILTACGGGSTEGEAAKQVVNVYNYSDYIAEDTIPNFEAATGIKVIYDVFDSDEMVEAKLLAGDSGYDVVVPTLKFFGRQIQAGVFRPLDKTKIPNWDNLDAEVMARIASQDPGNNYGVPYMMGTTGIGYNVAKLKERFGEDTAIANSWDLVFKPENIAKMQDCGVTLLDTPADLFCPCGHEAALTADSVARLQVQMVCGTANNQLGDAQAGQILAGRGILYAPDYVVNAGGVMNVSLELDGYNRERAMRLIRSIHSNLGKVFDHAEQHGCTPQQAADRIAEQRLAAIGKLNLPLGRATPRMSRLRGE